MMKLYAIILLLALQQVSAAAGTTSPADSTDPPSPEQPATVVHSPPTSLLAIDPDLSMRSGVANLLTAHRLVSIGEDHLLHTRWSTEKSLTTRTLGIAGRVAKLIWLDLPVDYFTVVLAHEYFGHGARYRELNLTDIDYGYDRPPPYGKGGGQASGSMPAGTVTDPELLAIWTGGLEVHQQLNASLRQRWMRGGIIHYREAFLYFWSFQIGFNYLQGSIPLDQESGHYNDPQAYIQILNRMNGYHDVAALHYRLPDLQKQMKADLCDPFLWLSIYTQLTGYFWNGEPDASLPMLPLGRFDYLPSIRTTLTPFGLAFHLDNYLRFDNRLLRIDLNLGDDAFHAGWGGVGITVEKLLSRDRFDLDLRLDGWKQPQLDLSGQSAAGANIGGAISLRGHYRQAWERVPLFVVVEAGFKSRGFLAGYNLDQAPSLLLGIAAEI